MRKFKETMKILALIWINAILIIGSLTVTGCEESSSSHEPKYRRGQVVHMVIDDRPVMITEVWPRAYKGITYTIRTTANTESTAFLGGDVDAAPYANLDVFEFELKE